MAGKDSRTLGYIPGVTRVLLILLLLAGSLEAQSSPYLPIDHPMAGLVEWLIQRGSLVDPTPMVRPLRRLDVVQAIDQSGLDSTSYQGRVAREVRAALADRPEEDWFRVEPAVGLQTFSRARRDLFHPAGAGGTRLYVEGTFEGRFGSVVVASRAMAENRLKLDPDWQGGTFQQRKSQAYRFNDAYISAQFKRIRLFFGQIDRNWGPVGSLGLSIANYGYPRTDFGFEIVLKQLQFQIVGTELTKIRSVDGTDHKRYFMAHRLNAAVTKHLNLSLWETAILAGREQSFDPGFKNALILFSFPIQLGLADHRNTIIGGDLSWRTPGGVLLQGQAMIDDRWRRRADSVTGEPAHPGRYALTGVGSGGLGDRLGWRVSAALVSSLAYRTIDSAESFLDRGIGIGPNFTDLVRVDAELSIPVRRHWLVSPGISWLKQGEGRIGAPFPADSVLTKTPELFIGTPSITWRVGAGIVGQRGPLALRGAGGWFHTTNPDHRLGTRRNRFEARLEATIRTRWSGSLK